MINIKITISPHPVRLEIGMILLLGSIATSLILSSMENRNINDQINIYQYIIDFGLVVHDDH